MNYSFIRKLLFLLNPETAHRVTLAGLRAAHFFGLCQRMAPQVSSTPKTIMGISFPNPIGLAAGFDKNGDAIDALGALGLGFLEIGTITPRPQAGNPPPRIFRLPESRALINRLGFNNKGVDYLVNRLKKMRYRGVLGINIGKNQDTPIESASQDYLYAFRALAPFASYITMNISSPNTKNLRTLQQGDLLFSLLQTMKEEQSALQKYVPLVVKISPDLTSEELKTMADIFLAQKVDGVIATNTTISRNEVHDSRYAEKEGGLSGKPLSARSTTVIRELYALLQDKIPIIASGGIVDVQDGLDKIAAGACLLQLYTGLVYRGPQLLFDILNQH